MRFTCHQQLLWSGLTFFWGFDHAVFEKHIGSSCKPHDWDLCMNIAALFKAVTCLFEQRWTSGHQGLYKMEHILAAVYEKFGLKVNMKS